MAVAGRQPLSRRRVLEEAVRFADREGLEALTMRKLGAELGAEGDVALQPRPEQGRALLEGWWRFCWASWRFAARSGLGGAHPGGVLAFGRARARAPQRFSVARQPAARDHGRVWLVEEFWQTLRDAGFGRRRRCTPSVCSRATPSGTRWRRSGASRSSPTAPASARGRSHLRSSLPCASWYPAREGDTTRSSSSAWTFYCPARRTGSDRGSGRLSPCLCLSCRLVRGWLQVLRCWSPVPSGTCWIFAPSAGTTPRRLRCPARGQVNRGRIRREGGLCDPKSTWPRRARLESERWT